jgi:hypothetical protein
MPVDPLSALSIAASVIQLVDFSCEIVSRSKDLYKSTDRILKENARAETVPVRLKQMISKLQERVGNNLNLVLSKEDEVVQHNRLRDICKECSSASEELVSHLNKLKVPTGTENRKWKSFRQA